MAFGNYTILSSKTPVNPPRHVIERMLDTVEGGGSVLWDFNGLVRAVPAAVVRNLAQLAKDLDSRPQRTAIDTASKWALALTWEQTVPLGQDRDELGSEGPEPSPAGTGPAEQ